MKRLYVSFVIFIIHFFIDKAILKEYIRSFNELDDELYSQYIPNSQAEQFLENNIPLFECPDKQLEKTYYFRWWTYRKHIKRTSEGYVITEFLPQVDWSGKFNTINCAVGHHFYEGRWLHNSDILAEYGQFWFTGGGNPRAYIKKRTTYRLQFYSIASCKHVSKCTNVTLTCIKLPDFAPVVLCKTLNCRFHERYPIKKEGNRVEKSDGII